MLILFPPFNILALAFQFGNLNCLFNVCLDSPSASKLVFA